MRCLYLLIFLFYFNSLFSIDLKVKAGDLKKSGFLDYSFSSSLSLETISPSSVTYEDKLITENFNIAIYNKDLYFLISKNDSTLSFENEISLVDLKKIQFRLLNSYSDGECSIINHSLFLSFPTLITPGMILNKSFSTIKKTGSKFLLFLHYSYNNYESILFIEHIDFFTTPFNKELNNSVNLKSINSLSLNNFDIKLIFEKRYEYIRNKNNFQIKLDYTLGKLLPSCDIEYKDIQESEYNYMLNTKAGLKYKGFKTINELYWGIKYINYPIHYGKVSSSYAIKNWKLITELPWEYIHNLEYTPKIMIKYDYKKIRGRLELIYFPEKIKKWELIVDIYSLL